MPHTKNVARLLNSQPASEAYDAFVMTLCIFEGCQLIKTFNYKQNIQFALKGKQIYTNL